jgi:triacylglycerol lipase
MNALTPGEAAAIAAGVYLLQRRSLSELRENGQVLGCENLFTVDDGLVFKAASGMAGFKAISGFGYVAVGKGKFAGDMLIATRGTLGGKLGPDWMSNYNIGMQLGPTGLPVHAGFHEVWKSSHQAIAAFMRNRNPTRIHCVGHSLGGALATLNADFFTGSKIAGVSLYTFGSPRTGDMLFSRSLTRRMTASHGCSIYRVYHPSDPVPMIPLFPFLHLPTGPGTALQVSNDIHNLVSSDAHSMADSYEKAVASLSWNDMEKSSMPRPDEQRQVKAWLERAAEGKGGMLMGSAKLLSMIGRAMKWLLATAGALIANETSASITAGLTVLDQLAWMLTRAAHLSKELGVALSALIGAIFSFLGRRIVQVNDISVAFVRWVLDLLFTTLRATAYRAVDFALRGR